MSAVTSVVQPAFDCGIDAAVAPRGQDVHGRPSPEGAPTYITAPAVRQELGLTPIVLTLRSRRYREPAFLPLSKAS